MTKTSIINTFGNSPNISNIPRYDYGARFYDAALGRWFVVDPLAEAYSDVSQNVKKLQKIYH